MNPYYLDYSEYLERFFGVRKVQKISINVGAGCPNRDGTIGTGGCIYCNNESFTPAYCFENQSITAQLEAGRKFFARKYPNMQYLAYFQSFTNTYRKGVEELESQFVEAMNADGVVGLIVGTRPDCVSDEVVSMLARLNTVKSVFVELGVETMCDETLRLINRGHTSAASRDAITRLAQAGLHVGVHLIAGLPSEDEARTLASIDEVCALPVESIKLHHLQILRGTTLESLWRDGRVDVKEYSVEEYLEFCKRVVARVPRTICIERFLASAPPQLVISPHWGLKNHEFINLLHNSISANKRSRGMGSA